MKRWNGWGDGAVHYPLSASAVEFLSSLIGPGSSAPDASLEGVLSSVPASRLPSHPSISLDPEERLRHARGQSLPDWVALRSGRSGPFPDGVAYPSTVQQVRELIGFAGQSGSHLIPYGGGTSVLGHINPPEMDVPTLTLDLSRLNRMLALDSASLLATFEAGVRGPGLERQLRSQGYTLGHFPQSFEFSTLGGWIATRSSGQQSYYYGRIEDMFAGGTLETPAGPLTIHPYPASAAGPDVRHLILGSEGRFGVITQATVRIRKFPESEGFYGIIFPDWEPAVEAVRAIAQSELPVSMLRLSDPQETEATFALSGKDRLVALARRTLKLLGYGTSRCLLVFGVTGERQQAGYLRDRVYAIARRRGGLASGAFIGDLWRKSRFLAPYLRNALWERGFAIDTIETAVPWVRLLPLATATKAAIQDAAAGCGIRALVLTHLSHIYRDGASIYLTVLFPRSSHSDETLEAWRAMKSAASAVIISHHATISHQHGVGRDHAGYLPGEKGPLGMAMLASVRTACDPQGLFNPGVLFEADRGS